MKSVNVLVSRICIQDSIAEAMQVEGAGKCSLLQINAIFSSNVARVNGFTTYPEAPCCAAWITLFTVSLRIAVSN